MFDNEKRDVKENKILKLDESLLEILLKDNTTHKNIIWATTNYEYLGRGYKSNDNIEIYSITGKNGNLIKPRIEKSKKEQQERIKQKAEVFTPSWVVNVQNNLVDKAWFERENIFNIEEEKKWKTIYDKIIFPENKTWLDYIKLKRLEITCGEAPYLVTRYDAVTGKIIPVKDRVGLLDRKLRIISENIDKENEWIEYVEIAYKNIYGFEWQGDNLLLARENLLYTFIDYYKDKFKGKPTLDEQKEIAEIISYNIWQMDGLKLVIPNTCHKEEFQQVTLFSMMGIKEPKIETECMGCKKGNYKYHNGIYAKIKNWDTGRMIMFKTIMSRGEK